MKEYYKNIIYGNFFFIKVFCLWNFLYFFDWEFFFDMNLKVKFFDIKVVIYSWFCKYEDNISLR